MVQQPQLPEHLVQAIRDGWLIASVGAGFPTAAGLYRPGWEELGKVSEDFGGVGGAPTG